MYKPEEYYFHRTERKSLFICNPVKVFLTYELAKYYKDQFEQFSTYGVNGYKITSVKLAKDKPSASEIITLP
jgi:hypothetical protein